MIKSILKFFGLYLSNIPSYHDVVVIVDGKEYTIFNNYGLELTCTRVGGWQLWYKSMRRDKDYQLIGEEYGEKPFEIRVGETVICKSENWQREFNE